MPIPLLNKAQMQVGESILVIIIVVILGAFMLVFSANAAERDFQDQVGQIQDLTALETVKAASSLYELSCSKSGVTEVCFDLHKALAVAELFETETDLVNLYYYDIFGDSKVTLNTIYPEEHNLTLYWNNASDDEQESVPVSIPVIVHNSSADSNMFGIFTVHRFFGGTG